VGRRMMGGQSTYLPLRVNSGGVIPPIFASSLLAFPATAALMLGTRWPFVKIDCEHVALGRTAVHRGLRDADRGFSRFFYVGIVFIRRELADNMRKNGGFIPGIRPGRTTSGICKPDPEAADVYRRGLSRHRLPFARMDDCGYSPESLAGGGWEAIV